MMIVVIEHRIGIRRYLIRDTHLQEHTPQHPLQSFQHHLVIPPTWFLQLRDEHLRRVDRSRHDGWEEGDIGSERHKVPARLHIPFIYLNHIRNQFEREEADAYRHNDIERAPVGMQSHQSEQRRELLNKEIHVLKVQQQTSPQHNTNHHQRFRIDIW